MRAWVLHGIGDLRFETVEEPAPKEQEVLVQVKAAGICGSDIPRVYKNGAHVHPLIPGHEFSGVVAEVGAGVDASWLGQKVGVFPLIPCRSCPPCQREYYEMCRHYGYIGSRRDGAFAEYVTVPAWNLVRLPDNISFQEAAMLEPMAVAVHAMRRIHPTPSDTVAVCGLGTIGLFLVMFLKEAGVRRILAVGNKESQRQAVLKLGLPAEDFYDSRWQDAREQDAKGQGRPVQSTTAQSIAVQSTAAQNIIIQDVPRISSWIRSRTDGLGADVFFECVGKEETYAQAVESTAPLGKVMLVGNPFSDMGLDRDVYWKILRDQLTVMGTWNSSFRHHPEDDWSYVLRCLSEKRIAPAELITHRYPLEELEKGLHIMRDKTEDYGKVMACW